MVSLLPLAAADVPATCAIAPPSPCHSPSEMRKSRSFGRISGFAFVSFTKSVRRLLNCNSSDLRWSLAAFCVFVSAALCFGAMLRDVAMRSAGAATQARAN